MARPKDHLFLMMAATLLANPFSSCQPIFCEYQEFAVNPPSTILPPASAEAKAPDIWHKIEARFITIEYADGIDLESIDRKINERDFLISSLPAARKTSNIEERISRRMDEIFTRAREVLDMWPSRLRVKVKIFKDNDELRAEYYKMFNMSEDLKSFYIYQHNTVYTSAEYISDSVIAHEMAHAIVDHYFSSIPPAKVRELMASYVDLHLDED